MVGLDELVLTAVPYIGIRQNSTNPDYSIQTNDIMQFTGLLDKNGKEIYESDIIRYSNHGLVAEVWWNEKQAKFQWGKFGLTKIQGEKLYTIIGNVFENPDLLTPDSLKDEE